MIDQEMAGKVAIVTGGGRLRSIGRATAVALAEWGCDVVVTGTGRDPKTLPPDEQATGWRDIDSTAEQVRTLGRRCLPIVVDITDEASVQRLADHTKAEFGRIDILVNNAAFARGEDRVPAVHMKPDLFWQVLKVKIFGSFLCVKAVAPVMIDAGRGGSIVNLSSNAAPRGTINTSAYAAANGGIESATRSWARELAQHNIRVNAVRPGPIDTSRMDDWGRGDRWENYIKTTVPLGRPGTDEDVGRFIALVCTRDMAYVTGQCMTIDGGAVMWA